MAGAVMTLAGVMLSGNALLAGAGKALLPMGLLLLAAGGGLWWLARGRSGASASPPAAPPAGARRGPFAAADEVVDRTVTELLRAKAQEPDASARIVPPSRWVSEVFDVIEWRRFEAVVERLFQQAGFETRSQSHGADGGVDIWLYSRTQPGQAVSVVQCKHWSGKRVGVDKIRELRGVMAAHSVARGQFATTSSFTPDAAEFAKANAINLLDVRRLLELIAQRGEAEQRELLAVALEGDYWRPTCVNCGVKMVERESRRDGKSFWGCPNYRKRGCKAMPMKSAG
jgi:restriction system protein